MRITQQEYDEWLRNNPVLAKRNPQNPPELSVTKPEPFVCNEPMDKEKGEAEMSGRFLVCIVAYRARLLDPDNLCGKFAIDCLRYAGAIPDDSAKFIEVKTTQKKVDCKKDECTEIVVYQL